MFCPTSIGATHSTTVKHTEDNSPNRFYHEKAVEDLIIIALEKMQRSLRHLGVDAEIECNHLRTEHGTSCHLQKMANLSVLINVWRIKMNKISIYTAEDIREKMIDNLLNSEAVASEYDSIMDAILTAIKDYEFEIIYDVPPLLQRNICMLFGMLGFFVTPVGTQHKIIISWNGENTLIAKRTADELDNN